MPQVIPSQKTTIVVPGKPIIKTDPDQTTVVHEVQLDDEQPYTQQELEELVNLHMDSEADDLGEVASKEEEEYAEEQ